LQPVRIGVLGAARITPTAVVKPARQLPDDATVVAVAARDRGRAAKFAAKHQIPTVHDTYEDLLADPEVDAVYNPLPNGLHGKWTIAALLAGKHVLCEKPFTANAQEAQSVAAAAEMAREAQGLVTMEAFHYRYHPLADLVKTFVDEELIGRVDRIEARAIVPYLKPGDIRFDWSLAGGSLMDMGCYAVHQIRLVAGAEPTVVSAEAKTKSPEIDRWIRAHLRWADGRTGMITVAMYSLAMPMIDLKVRGDRGLLKVLNPTQPGFFNRVTLKPTRTAAAPPPPVRDPLARPGVSNLRINLPTAAEIEAGKTKHMRVRGETTYWYQMRAFVDAIRNGTPVLTGPEDAVKNMEMIDAIYRAAGLQPRMPTP
jgi:predicted dehydrogenase